MTHSDHARKGRPVTYGKFNTRDELKNNALRLKTERGLSISSIARICNVSAPTIRSILDI